MSTWLVIAIMAIVTVGVVAIYSRRNGVRTPGAERPHGGPSADYAGDREAARLASMSAEDWAWETATLQRAQVNRDRADAARQQG